MKLIFRTYRQRQRECHATHRLGPVVASALRTLASENDQIDELTSDRNRRKLIRQPRADPREAKHAGGNGKTLTIKWIRAAGGACP